MSDRIVRPTFSGSPDFRAPASDENAKIMVALAFACAGLFYVATYYVGAWVFSLLR